MFCLLPFTDFQIKSNGDVHCCCEDWLPLPLGNLFQSTPEEIWNGETAKKIRLSILDQSFRYCTRCQFLPGPGGPITPQKNSRLCVNPDLSVDRITTLMLNYDRTCNLTCPSCRSHVVGPEHDPSSTRRAHAAMLDSKILDMSDQIYLTGAGDPLSSPTYRDFLKNLHLTSPRIPQIVLHTNGQLLDENHWTDLGPSREHVTTIVVSVDAATPETYSTNRGGSWTRLWKNIDFINQVRLKQNITLVLAFVVQHNNFKELLPFRQLALNHGANSVTVYYLRNWGTYSRDEYSRRAVHLPAHPDYHEFSTIMTDPLLTSDQKINLPAFPARSLENT